MFKKGFLLTTNKCTWFIGKGIKDRSLKATAVLGDFNLKNGLRVDILKIAYYVTHLSHQLACPKEDHGVGIVMVCSI